MPVDFKTIMDLPKVLKELKFLRESHTPEYNEYLQSVKLVDIHMPVIFPKLAKFYDVQGVVLQSLMLRGFYESRKFQARKDDVFVVSFPKTGTTWVQEATYLIGTEGNFKKAKSSNLERRFPLLELTDVDNNKNKKQQRFFKSHLPFSLLPQSVHDNKCKVIYVTRNPKDTVVSMYHFYKMLKLMQYHGPLEEFVHGFINNKITYAPYARSVKEFWSHRNDENVLFLTYEGLTMDFFGSLRRIADFLNKPLSDELMEQIANHCSFQKMSSNPKVNFSQWKDNGMAQQDATVNFMRKGKSGESCLGQIGRAHV